MWRSAVPFLVQQFQRMTRIDPCTHIIFQSHTGVVFLCIEHEIA